MMHEGLAKHKEGRCLVSVKGLHERTLGITSKNLKTFFIYFGIGLDCKT